MLTRRTETLRGHRGQISLPGGQRDAGDATLVDTALRETCEELGICAGTIEVLGSLSPIYIPPSDFEVFPTVAALERDLPSGPILPKWPRFSPCSSQPCWIRVIKEEQRDFHGTAIHVPYYALAHKVWGATAIILSEMEGRLRAAVPEDVVMGAVKFPIQRIHNVDMFLIFSQYIDSINEIN